MVKMQMTITREQLTALKNWFTGYVHTFHYDEPELQQNVELKETHSIRVCEEISYIGKQLSLNDHELRLAEIIGLFHDVGRFEQYDRYRTFVDRSSEDHAGLGIKALKKSGVLESFDHHIKDIILRAIQYHNRASLPPELREPCLLYAKLIRDADKLDIWKIATDYYYREGHTKNAAIELDLPDTPGFSEEVYHDLKNRRIVNVMHVKNLNDFKLLQTGWVFDINFQPTLDRFRERSYLSLIRDVLPESKQIDEIFHRIQAETQVSTVDR